MNRYWTDAKWYLVPLLLLAGYCFCFPYSLGMDLPNHVARAYILEKCLGGASSPLCDNFSLRFVPLPYFFSDLLISLLLKVFPIFLADKVAVFLMLAICWPM